MNFKTISAFVGILTSYLAFSATLTVDFSVKHGIPGGGREGVLQEHKVAYFVIDRSGSMGEKSLPGSRKPNDALIESLEKRLYTIPEGASVFVIPFASEIKEKQPYPKFTANDRKTILDFVKKDNLSGQTVLYDAEDQALTDAQRMMQRDPAADVSVFVYTDGEHLTPWNYEGEYMARYQIKRTGLGKRGFVENPDYASELAAAKKKFNEKFAEFVSKPNVEVEYQWLSRETPPKSMPRVPRIDTDLFLKSGALKHPVEEHDQKLSCQLFLPLIVKNWEKVKGQKASLDFCVDGKTVQQVIEFKEDNQPVRFVFPSIPDDREVTATLSVSRLPDGKNADGTTDFSLKLDKPLTWKIAPPKQLSVEVQKCSTVVAKGEKVSLKARSNELGASFAWDINGEKRQGDSVQYSANQPGTLRYSVTASKSGFRNSLPVSGTVEVIPTGVKVASDSSRHEVGKASTFKAIATGPCERYVWAVDGKRVPGETAALNFTFDKSGPHNIGVTAFYKKGSITADAEVLSVNVAAAPFLEILAPISYDGDVENAQFQAKKTIDYVARVEGDLTEVEWQSKLKGEVKATNPSNFKEGKYFSKFTPPEGGYYDVVATAKGPAGTVTKTVQIFVKSAEIRVDIVSPTANQDIMTGNPFTMIAKVKGPVKGVRWRMTKVSTGDTIPFGPSDNSTVKDGESQTSIEAKIPVEIGDAAVLISAEPILANTQDAESVIPAQVTIDATTFGAISYVPETQSLNWKRVKYGTEIQLSVKREGAVKEVHWFTENVDGQEVQLKNDNGVPLTGDSINVTVPARKGQNKYIVVYYAKGLMPDGSLVKCKGVEVIAIEAVCPCSFAGPLDIHPGINDSKVGRGEVIHVTLVTNPKDCSDCIQDQSIVWFLDGKVDKKGIRAFDLVFEKSQYGKHELDVCADCKICGTHYGVEVCSDAEAQKVACVLFRSTPIEVIHKKPIAGFVMSPKAGGYKAFPFTVDLTSTSSGDCDKFEWLCDGKVVASGATLAECAPMVPFGRGVHKYSLRVSSDYGASDTADPQELKTWNLLLVLLLLLVAMGLSALAIWYWSGDDPRFWKIRSCFDEDPEGATPNQMINYYAGGSITLDRKYHDKKAGKWKSVWNTKWNYAEFPLSMLVRDWKSRRFGEYIVHVSATSLSSSAKRAGHYAQPLLKFANPGSLVALDQNGIYATIRILDPEYLEEKDVAKKTCLRLMVDTTRKGTSIYTWYKVVAVVASLIAVGLVSWWIAF